MSGNRVVSVKTYKTKEEQEKAKKSTKTANTKQSQKTANINKKGGNNIGQSQKKRKTQKG